MPISVVLPFSHTSTEHEPQLVLCGDGQQCVSTAATAQHIQPVAEAITLLLAVGPLICSDAARNGELDVSLLERLFERPLYATSMGPSNGDWRPCTRLVKVRHPSRLKRPLTIRLRVRACFAVRTTGATLRCS